MKVSVVVPASGISRRLGLDTPKQFLKIKEKPLLVWTLENLEQSESVDEIILVVSESMTSFVSQEIVNGFNFKKVKHIVVGGAKRCHSVYNGLQHVSQDIDLIAIHDAARPSFDVLLLEQAFESAMNHGSAVFAIPIHDTVKKVDSNLKVMETIDRENLFRIQTPQIFKKNEIINAYHQAMKNQYLATDDAGMMEYAGYDVYLFPSNEKNIKVTTLEDISIIEKYLEERS